MKYGARNQWVGKVVHIRRGAVMCQVAVALEGGQVATSVMTLDSLRELRLRKGARVRVLVKAVNVLLASEE